MDKIIAVLMLVIGGIVLLVLLSFLFSWPIMALWNGCLVGAIDGIHKITWLQAWGIGVLASFLFKNNAIKTSSND